MRILIAEDEPASRKMLETLLAKSGHDVVAVGNGTEAWRAMTAPDAPRLAIFDWLMPEPDGEELCRRVRALETETPPYIIMVTIKGNKSDIVRGLEAGANDYISKPYDSGELHARINVGIRMLELQTALSERIALLRLHEQKIQVLLDEKTLLLHEVHHRIKNNLNTVMNLLSLQADSCAEASTVSSLRNAVSRMKSMSILYDKLYRSENLTAMSIRQYLPFLAREIMNIFPDSMKVGLEMDIPDVTLDVPLLSTIGMIVNELLFNAMKHAFRGRETGLISIAASVSGKSALLVFEDNGIGIPDTVSLDNPQSFGLKLVIGLAAQIGAAVQIDRTGGTRFAFTFTVS